MWISVDESKQRNVRKLFDEQTQKAARRLRWHAFVLSTEAENEGAQKIEHAAAVSKRSPSVMHWSAGDLH